MSSADQSSASGRLVNQTEAQEALAHGFYRRALLKLNAVQLPCLVGGAYALEFAIGLTHHTKDLDLFVREEDRDAVLAALESIGCRTEVTHPHWLAKAYSGKAFIDIIYNSGNGQAPVDYSWFNRARGGDLFGVPARFCALEETIWSKAFIMERERFDGADIAHVIRSCAEHIDWNHLVSRFADHSALLLSHLILFGYVYPGERSRVPSFVLRSLGEAVLQQWDEPATEPRLCRGTLLSRAQYLVDVDEIGYLDARVEPFGSMSPEAAQLWSSLADDPPHLKRD